MASHKVPVAELRALLSVVGEHGAQHLIEAEADLAQTSYLLSGAIEKLSESFMAIHASVTEQQAVIDTLLEGMDTNTESYQQVLTLREKISTEVNAAVTGLQFQDMTSQLIARVIKRIGGLKDSLETLAEHGNDMDIAHEHEEIVKQLEEMRSGLHMRNDALKGGLNKSVKQEDMTSGDIELF